MDNQKELLGKFKIQGTIESVKPLGAGHINDSFLVNTKEPDFPDYLLQRINHSIFEDVDLLQQNILNVTNHIRWKLQEAGETDLDRKVLTVIPTLDDKLYYFDGYSYWRIYLFIPRSKSYDEINPALAFEAGMAFGDFQMYLSDIPDQIGETISNFHNMEFRMEQFREAVDRDAAGRLNHYLYFVDQIESRAEEMCLPERMYREGKLPKRINHCDTKVNNVLFDESGRILCVVDLDTVMPGFVLSDFGDFIRTGANTGAEDDPDLSRVGVNLDIFEAYAQGYARKAASFLQPVEIEYLAFGARLLTYMQTVRFFTDFLNGDIYYKIHFPEHNLQRTKAQFKLLQEMEVRYDAMRQLVLAQFPH